jgi:O-antigen/teichoic acid export membrane protein
LGLLRPHHRNTLIYLGVSVLSRGASILLIPLYTSRLTPAEYGDYGLCQTLFWLAPPIVTLSLINAVGRFFFDDVDPAARARKIGRIATSMIALSLAAGLVGELIVELFRPNVGALTPTHLRLVVLICVMMPLTEIPAIYFRMSERAFAYAAYNLGLFAITATTTAYLMLAHDLGLTGLLGGSAAAQVAGGLFACGFVWSLGGRWPPRTLFVEAVKYSVPFIPHMIGNSLMVGVDRWALEYFGLRSGLGLYTLATQLTMPIQLATAAWNEASSPRFLATWRDGGYPAARRALPRIVAGFVATGGGALIAILAALPLLRYFVGERFQGAFHLVPWIGLSLVVGTLFSAFINVLFLRKNTRIIPVLTLTSVAVNVALNFVLVPRYGVYGTILATGLAFTFRSGLMLRFALRELERSDAGTAPA